jgi:hypothetical protein
MSSHDLIDDGETQPRTVLTGMVGTPVTTHEIAQALLIEARPFIANARCSPGPTKTWIMPPAGVT